MYSSLKGVVLVWFLVLVLGGGGGGGGLGEVYPGSCSLGVGGGAALPTSQTGMFEVPGSNPPSYH